MFFPAVGFSVNTLALLGLVLAVGLVVDDAIVVVEAIEAKIEQGRSPRDAALEAMDEVGGALVGIALVLSAVFIPSGFMAGITGSLYRQFSLTIAFSVLLSSVLGGYLFVWNNDYFSAGIDSFSRTESRGKYSLPSLRHI